MPVSRLMGSSGILLLLLCIWSCQYFGSSTPHHKKCIRQGYLHGDTNLLPTTQKHDTGGTKMRGASRVEQPNTLGHGKVHVHFTGH